MSLINNNIKKPVLILFSSLVLLSYTNIAYGQDSGGYAGAFLRMGLSARVKAMGSAFTAVADDGAAQYYNPAGIPFFTQKQITLSYRSLSLDRKFNYVGYAQSLKPTAGFALGWLNAGVDNIDGRNFNGEKFGDISDSENAFYFSFANKINDKVAFGLSGKVLYRKLYELSAKGVGYDFGILIKPVKNLSIGLLIKDFKAKFKWNSNDIYDRGSTTEDEFPVVFNGGIAYRLDRYGFLAAFDVVKSSKDNWNFNIGAEKVLMKRYFLRAGMEHNNPCFGAGALWNWKNRTIRVDYALVTVEHDDVENHIFSLNFGI